MGPSARLLLGHCSPGRWPESVPMEIEATDPLEGITPVTLWVRLDSTRMAYIIAVTLLGTGHGRF